ncbi:MAG: copper homeostasis protein CutC [bacterium]|nr:copper homeostasis protein CutC [bacterium]
MDDILIEVCLDSADSAVAARQGGARRVELCDNLIEGGTTPSAGMIAATRRAVDIGLQVMIRPRGGDFCYSPRELEAMLHDIATARELGADGLVFGALTGDGTIDRATTRELIAAARPLAVTFHRAFDMTRDPIAALDTLLELGVERLLTSGQEATVADGVELVAELVRRAGDQLVVMPGCGITPRNVGRIVAETGAREIHVVGNETVESPMRYRNPRCFMGGELRSPEYRRSVTAAAQIRAFRERPVSSEPL